MARILIVSFVEWAGAFQRPQHLAIGLARRGHRVTYASPGFIHRRGKRFESGVALPPTLQVLQPMQWPGASRASMIASLNSRLMQTALSKLEDRHFDLIVFNDPRWAEVAAAIPASKRAFDCMDDLSAASPSAEWASRREREALAAADRVWTGTASLADRLAGQHPHVRFIPGGVDGAHFANPDPLDVQRVKSELPEGDGPLAGYFGVLNERFDLPLVEALLESGPWRVLLIGPATSRAPRLPNHPRLRWIGPRPYAALPAYLAHFDLGLIPYDNTGPHRFLYPVKALEYLAGGKPVLATPLPDVVRFLGGFVELAATAQDWNEAGKRLLAPDEATLTKAGAGRDYAFSRSWEAMVDEVEEELAALGIPKSQG